MKLKLINLFEAVVKKTYKQWLNDMIKKYPNKSIDYFIKKIPDKVVKNELEAKLKDLLNNRRFDKNDSKKNLKNKVLNKNNKAIIKKRGVK